MYNPYAGLPGAFDPAMSRQLLQLPDAPEFVFSEEAAVKHRGIGENLTFITGSAYLIGAVLGASYGSYQALSSTPTGSLTDSTKCGPVPHARTHILPCAYVLAQRAKPLGERARENNPRPAGCGSIAC